MKTKLMTIAMMMAVLGTISCSKDLYDEGKANELKEAEDAAKQAELVAQYKANFEKRYGQIDPNQSWDFSGYTSASQARTRSGQVTSVRKEGLSAYKGLVNDDRNIIETQIDYTKELKTWNPSISVILWPAYCHSKAGATYSSYSIKVYDNGNFTEIFPPVNTSNTSGNGYWYDIQKNNSTMNANSGRTVNSKSFQEEENAYWVAYPVYTNSNTAGREANANVMANISDYKIEYYKEVIIGGDKFWCFDCNNDGDYSDMIFLVDDADPMPIRKRYMIEDLGATDDFDFNDIVVDVIEQNGGQKAIVRAMGGTLNFTLTIGSTSWTKKGSKVNVRVNGEIVEQDTEVTTMYNTQAPEYDFVLAEYTVTGWDWRTNNISVTVEGNDNLSVKKVIPFPKEGEAPMIIAFDPITTHWNKERVPFDTGFYKPLDSADDAQ